MVALVFNRFDWESEDGFMGVCFLRGFLDWGVSGESVVVVESDKADMDVETFYDGFLAKIVIAEGETAPVGAAIGLLAETEEEIAEAKAKGGAAPAAAKPSPVEEKVLPPPAPPATPAPVAAVVVAPEPVAPEVVRSGRIVATPYAKKLAKQFNVDLGAVAGSGPSGRITATDVEAAAGKTPTPAAPSVAQPAAVAAVAAATAPKLAAVPAPAAAPAPAGSVAFTSMQAGVARNMVDSMSVPTFRVGYTITTDALDALYKKVSDGSIGFRLLFLFLFNSLTLFLIELFR